jgi:hypothetical protein
MQNQNNKKRNGMSVKQELFGKGIQWGGEGERKGWWEAIMIKLLCTHVWKKIQ